MAKIGFTLSRIRMTLALFFSFSTQVLCDIHSDINDALQYMIDESDYDIVDTQTNCASDNRDAYYSVSLNSGTKMLQDPKSFWLLTGVNHEMSNQTTYSLFALWTGNPSNFRVNTFQVNNFEYGDRNLLSDEEYSMFYSVQLTRQENCLSGIVGFCIQRDII